MPRDNRSLPIPRSLPPAPDRSSDEISAAGDFTDDSAAMDLPTAGGALGLIALGVLMCLAIFFVVGPLALDAIGAVVRWWDGV